MSSRQITAGFAVLLLAATVIDALLWGWAGLLATGGGGLLLLALLVLIVRRSRSVGLK